MAALYSEYPPAATAAATTPANPSLDRAAEADLSMPSVRKRVARARFELLQNLLRPGPLALRMVGPDRVIPVSAAGAAFALRKLAETVIPVRICRDGVALYPEHEGPIRYFYQQGERLHLAGPGRLLEIDADISAWVLHADQPDGPAIYLLLAEHDREGVVQICGQRPQCTAWRALMEWLLLRDGMRAGSPPKIESE